VSYHVITVILITIFNLDDRMFGIASCSTLYQYLDPKFLLCCEGMGQVSLLGLHDHHEARLTRVVQVAEAPSLMNVENLKMVISNRIGKFFQSC
jgi:hypothetical protein